MLLARLFEKLDRTIEKMILKLDPSSCLYSVTPQIYIFRNTFESYFIYGCIGVLS